MAGGRLFGDWDRAKTWVSTLAERARVAIVVSRDTALEEAALEARAEILSNQIQPPSKKSSGQRTGAGDTMPYTYPAAPKNPTTLVDTGTYADAIGVYSTSDGTKYVGLPPSGVHSPSGLPWATLYRWLRFGTARMPPRPHIDTAAQRVFAKYGKKLRSMGFLVR